MARFCTSFGLAKNFCPSHSLRTVRPTAFDTDVLQRLASWRNRPPQQTLDIFWRDPVFLCPGHKYFADIFRPVVNPDAQQFTNRSDHGALDHVRLETAAFFAVDVVRDRDGVRAVWTRIGAALEHKGGEGCNITRDALQVERKSCLILPKPDDNGSMDS